MTLQAPTQASFAGSAPLDYVALSRRFARDLFADVIPFWLKNSLDREHGGYFTCLDREGRVFDTDKFVWLQARQVWTLSMLAQRAAAEHAGDATRAEWLEAARLGADFLRTHGRNGNGDWHFSLDRAGRPLTQPYSIFSDCFAAMAFSQFAQATGDEAARGVARETYARILQRRRDPKGPFNKAMPGARPLRALAVPMILANLTLELEWLLEPGECRTIVEQCVREVFEFRDPAAGILREHITPEGQSLDSFEGRVINPGHGIEASWFLIDLARRFKLNDVIEPATQIILNTLDYGWDAEHGGLFYFLDSKGAPPQQLEWDQKLWWVHVEAMVATAMAFAETGDVRCEQWFARLCDYSLPRFPDPQHGEWFGYLNRRGEVLLPLKGGKWKGCFHVPRALFMLNQETARIAHKQALQS